MTVSNLENKVTPTTKIFTTKKWIPIARPYQLPQAREQTSTIESARSNRTSTCNSCTIGGETKEWLTGHHVPTELICG